MSFNNSTWALQSAGQSFGTLKVWSFETTDAESVVMTSGYFNEKHDYVDIGDKIDVLHGTGSISLRVASNSNGIITVLPWVAAITPVPPVVAPFTVVAAGTHTTSSTTGVNQTVTIPGLLATDTCVVTLDNAGEANTHIVSVGMHDGHFVVIFLGDPLNGHKFNYIVARAAS